MIKKYILFCLIFGNILFSQRKNDISIKILNKKIIENQNVDIVIKNNSKKNYHILIDTLFTADAIFDNDYFFNPYFIVTDTKKNEILKISDIRESGSVVDTKDSKTFKIAQNNLILLEIKSKQALRFKIQFVVKRVLNKKHSTYFYINRKEKYFTQIKYKLTKYFVNMKYLENQINNYKNKKKGIYIGTIVSNKVPIIFEKKVSDSTDL